MEEEEEEGGAAGETPGRRRRVRRPPEERSPVARRRTRRPGEGDPAADRGRGRPPPPPPSRDLEATPGVGRPRRLPRPGTQEAEDGGGGHSSSSSIMMASALSPLAPPPGRSPPPPSPRTQSHSWHLPRPAAAPDRSSYPGASSRRSPSALASTVKVSWPLSPPQRGTSTTTSLSWKIDNHPTSPPPKSPSRIIQSHFRPRPPLSSTLCLTLGPSGTLPMTGGRSGRTTSSRSAPSARWRTSGRSTTTSRPSRS